MAIPLKILVTNESVLQAKYGPAYQNSIQPAIASLIKADKARGINTQLIAVDNAQTMASFSAKAVTKASNPSQNKRAIDAICKKMSPDYVCLLGSVDVIPHQDLGNPVPNDPDSQVPSDLPYACDHAYSKLITDFLLPTRVVGRLPDLTAGKQASYLTNLLQSTSKAQSIPSDQFMDYLGITAQVWQSSTALSLQNIFGNSTDLNDVPVASPPWGNLLSRFPHFINCHGAPADPHFYGQQGNTYPVAHDAAQLAGLSPGTVASVECCYGSELYDPSLAGGQPGICNTYLEKGATAFWGSSTIAYGPPTGNGQADLVCQFFLKHILTGMSSGEAALRTRLDYISTLSLADPTDLKTIAQFNLMGDPSLFPISLSQPKETLMKATTLTNLAKAKPVGETYERHAANWLAERQHLMKLGRVLGKAITHIDLESKQPASADIQKLLKGELDKQHAQELGMSSYSVVAPKAMPANAKTFLKAASFEKVHIAVGELPQGEAPFKRILAVIAKQQDTQLVINYVYSK